MPILTLLDQRYCTLYIYKEEVCSDGPCSLGADLGKRAG